jgi:hypothetical protein
MLARFNRKSEAAEEWNKRPARGADAMSDEPNGMDEWKLMIGAALRINERMAKPASLVSDAELDAAMDTLARISDAAGRSPPIPRSIMRCVLEKAAFARLQMTRLMP